MIVKTVITGQPVIHQVHRTSLPNDIENETCFHILGFDVMIDRHLKPWLIEINHAPSLLTDSAFDFTLKKNLVEDTIQLLCLT